MHIFYWQAKLHTNISESSSKIFILCFDDENEYFEELPMSRGLNQGMYRKDVIRTQGSNLHLSITEEVESDMDGY